MSALIPEVLWAQRSSDTDEAKNYIFLTISVPDVEKENLKLDLQPTGLKFEGESKSLKRNYSVELDFYAEIDTAASKINHTSKNVELKLQKKELKAEYWPRLLKESRKLHFLKTDFDKWVDEDEQEDAEADLDMGNMGGMGGMPGMGDMGMGGMGGMGGMPGMGGMGGMDFGGIDFSKLGGLGGAGGDDEGDADEDDMPGLEGDEGDEDDAAAKVEEVAEDTPKAADTAAAAEETKA
jgi:hypothetical protein